MKFSFTFSVLLLALATRAEVIWPATDGWITLQSSGSNYSDAGHDALNGGEDDNALDIVGDETYAAGYYLYRDDVLMPDGSTGDQLIIRMRLDNQKKNKSPGVWLAYFHTDASNSGVDWVLEVNGTLSRVKNPDADQDPYDFTTDTTLRLAKIEAGGEDAKTVEVTPITSPTNNWVYSGNANEFLNWAETKDGSFFNGDTDAFLDIAVPWDVFSSATGVWSTNAPISIILATSRSKTYSGIGIDGDVGAIGGSGATSLVTTTSESIPEPAVVTLIAGFSLALIIGRRIFKD